MPGMCGDVLGSLNDYNIYSVWIEVQMYLCLLKWIQILIKLLLLPILETLNKNYMCNNLMCIIYYV